MGTAKTIVIYWLKNSISFSRKQFSLLFIYAVSIHQLQEITLEKTIVDIDVAEFQIDLTFVALSRVKKLNRLLLKPYLNHERLLKINNSKAMI